MGATVPHLHEPKPGVSVRRVRRLLRAFGRLLAAVTRAADEDHADEHRERHQVDQLHEPVARVGEDEHGYVFSAAESSHSPRQVKHTISTSMTTCERAASFAEP